MRGVTDLPTQDFMTEHEFFDALVSNEFSSPEKILMAHVLQDAVHALKGEGGACPTWAKRALKREAVAWFLANDEKDHWVFTFRNVCEYLNLNRETILKGLQEYLQENKLKNVA